jgi:hypothetical protein
LEASGANWRETELIEGTVGGSFDLRNLLTVIMRDSWMADRATEK